MSTPATAREILATAARKPRGEVTTVMIAGKRLAIVDANWLDEHKSRAAADAFKVKFDSIFGGGAKK